MTVKELYDKAVRYGLQDEPVDEVSRLIPIQMERGVCGLCTKRKTDKCPWPNSSKLAAPICLEFARKEVKL